MKNKTGRKWSVLKDELKISGGGIYCVTPFDTLDNHGKTLYKIGMSLDLSKRLDDYITYFPNGVYMIAFLANPPVRVRDTRYVSQETKKSKYSKIEKDIFDYLVSKKAVQIHSPARVRNLNDRKEGQTEWFYCSEELIHEAFQQAYDKFGGDGHLFTFENINEKAAASERRKPNYVGKIIYHL